MLRTGSLVALLIVNNYHLTWSEKLVFQDFLKGNPIQIERADGNLLHRIVERGETLNSHFQFVTRLNCANAAGCAGKNHVAG